MFSLEQALGLIAAICVVFSFQCRTPQSLIIVQLVGYSFLLVHFYMINALTGAVMTVIGLIRLLVAFGVRWYPQLRQAKYLFLIVILSASYYFSSSYVDILPGIAYVLGTLAVFSTSSLKMRLMFLAAHPFWLTYNGYVGSYGGVLMEVANITSGLFALYRLRKRLDTEKKPL